MSFPTDRLPQKTELFIDGAWVDLTTLGRIRNDADVVITRGRANEQANVSASTCVATINNRDGLFSNRNPLSTYYQKLRRNVPFRHSVTESTPWLRLPPWLNYANEDGEDTFIEVRNAGKISTTDKSVLDITGDIDIRVEIEPDDWVTGTTMGSFLGGKYENITGDQRSWILMLGAVGQLSFRWSTNGVSFITAFSDKFDTTIPRQAFRVTLAVNDTGGIYRIRFYSSDSINGTWTQFGANLVGGAPTSIFSGTAPLVVGSRSVAELNGFPDIFPFAGKIHGFQVRNGINGTLVANMDPTVRTPGDTSWSDGLATPNTWTVTGPAEVTKSDYRFFGELAESPPKWDSTGVDVYVPVVAAGVTRRLTQGPSILNGALRRFLEAVDDSGYWPVEESTTATSLANVRKRGKPGTFADITLGPVSDFPASAGAARINSSASRLRFLPASGGSTGTTWVMFFFKLPAVPTNDVTLAEWSTSGAARRIVLEVRSAGTAFFTTVYDSDDVSLGTANTTFGSTTSIDNQWLCFQYRITDTGAGFDVIARWRNLGGTTYNHGVTVGTGTVGVGRESRVGGDPDLADAEFAHFQMGNSTYNMLNYGQAKAENAFLGEQAAVRLLRILREQGVDGYCIGDPFESVRMGPQPIDTLPNIVQECVDVDRGILFEPRDQLGYLYRTRRALYQQQAVQLDYAAGELSGDLQPVDDDQLTRNDVTVRRPTGSEGRSVKTEGPNNVNDPTTDPEGIGRYDVSLTKNASSDFKLPYLASHETFLGTWDELRYPSAQVELARSVFLTTAGLAKAAALCRLDIGDRLDLINLPAWLPPDDVAQLIQGYTETHRNRGREFRWNLSPYGPYLHSNNLLPIASNPNRRAAAVGSYLNAGITTTANSFVMKTTRGPAFGDSTSKPGNFPLGIMIGGEEMLVGAIGVKSGGSQLQTFSSVTRSVNGVVKTHDADDFVQVIQRFYLQL